MHQVYVKDVLAFYKLSNARSNCKIEFQFICLLLKRSFPMNKMYLALLLTIVSSASYAGSVVIEARDVDDRIDIYVDDVHQDSCEWSSNPGCYVGIKGRLSGTHDIRFKLTNYVYRGFCLTGGCGKYAADLAIRYNGDLLWSKSIYRRDNSRGVKYDTTIRCNFNSGSCWEK